ncbi:MAG: M1 family aminopeptidase [Ignavibacteria bacterium]
MFISIIKFELRLWLKSLSFYFYSFVFFFAALFSLSGSAGLFGEGSGGTGIANSPVDILSTAIFFNKLFLLLIPVIIGTVISRDYISKTNRFLFSYPVKKSDYLAGKFTGGFITVVFISILVMSGMALGLLLPGINSNQVIEFNLTAYLQTFFLYFLPNLFLVSVIVFAVVSRKKNIYSGFLAVIILLLLTRSISGIMFSTGFGFPEITADPFGEIFFENKIKYFSALELASIPIPFGIEYLVNRIFWMMTALVILFYTYRKFSFSETEKINARSFLKGKEIYTEEKFSPISHDIVFNFSFSENVKSIWRLSQYDFYFITRNLSFRILAVIGALFIGVLILKGNTDTGVKLLPVTWTIMSIPFIFYSLLIIFLTFLYSGLLMNRSESAGMKELECVTPVPNFVLYFSKLTALIKIQILMLLIMMITGILIQIYSGYYNFDIGNYVYTLFGIHLIGFVIWAVMALFIQTIVTNSFTGLIILVLLFLGIDYLPFGDAGSFVLKFNKNPEPDFFLKYSEISGFGHSVYPYFISKLYWTLFCLVLINLSIILNRRIKANTINERNKAVRSGFSSRKVMALAGLTAVFILSGMYIYNEKKNESKMQLTEDQKSDHMSYFQNEFGSYESLPQPRIVKLNFNMDIFPDESSFTTEGYYILVNKTNYAIDKLFLKSGYDEITSYTFSEGAEREAYDSVLKFSVYKLSKVIEPMDSIKLYFSIKNISNTLLTQNSNVLEDGTFIKSDIFPQIGFLNLKNENKINPEDSILHLNHYQRYDSDLIEYEAIVSTSKDQTVVMPGVLINEREEDGRKYFQYKSEGNIKFVLGINSGEFNIYNESHKGKELSIFYNKDHRNNIDNFADGIKSALEYNTDYFGDYQHSNISIIEFPRSEGSYATTSGNTIQISEIRFINDAGEDGEANTDISFYTAAHELTHQWWGNQIIPADAAGAHMLTESITEYTTAKIYERKFGKEKALDFLKIQYDRYLKGRAEENENEVALKYVNPEQTYISYGKGSIAFYILSEYLGEKNLNRILRSFLEKNKFKGPPYTTTLELVKYLKNETSENLHYMIYELFESADFEKFSEHYKKLENITE